MLKCKGSKNKIEALPILVYILNNKKPISYRNQNGIQSATNLEFKTQQNFQVVSRNEKKKEKEIKGTNFLFLRRGNAFANTDSLRLNPSILSSAAFHKQINKRTNKWSYCKFCEQQQERSRLVKR